MQYPVEEREVLRALLDLQRSKVFVWLLGQLDEEREQAEHVVLNSVPPDSRAERGREQLIGHALGLRRMATLISEHIDQLRKLVEHE